jgi:AcrR family transcriptional regulator
VLQDDPTGVESLRDRNVAARRQRILDAARHIIVKKGVPALTMRGLARESGLAVKTLYNLWGGRDAILRALVEQAMDRMDQALEQEAPLDDPLERCRAVVTVSVRHLVEDEAVSRSMVLAHYQGLSAGPSSAGVTARATQMQAVAIRTAIAQRLLTNLLDPEVLGRQIYHGYEMAHLQWAFGVIDEDGFRARALYGLYVALLGVATRRTRPFMEAELAKLERTLRAQARPARGSARKSA